MQALPIGTLAAWKHPATSGKPQARLLHIHGISEHSGRHQPTFDALNAMGVEVIRFDLRGSGKSPGKRQYINNFSDYVADANEVAKWIEQNLPELPLFVFGHSMGGAVAIHFLAQYSRPVAGLVLSAPAYKVGGEIPQWKILLGRVLVPFFPTLRLYSASSDGLSRDKNVVRAYRQDPLASHFNTLKQGDEVLKALQDVPRLCKKISAPTVILHGTSDSVILPEGSFEVLQSLGSTNRELHYLPGVYHEPHLDWESEKFFSLLCRWVEKRLSAGAASKEYRR